MIDGSVKKSVQNRMSEMDEVGGPFRWMSILKYVDHFGALVDDFDYTTFKSLKTKNALMQQDNTESTS